MSRLIDRLPAPKEVREKKALKMLGYKSYHMAEVVERGIPHMALFEEALRCKYLDGGKPYDKADFDKWLADYDEIPQFFIEEFIEFYPNALFVLTERNLESWVKSMNNTAAPMFTSLRRFPFTAIRRMDSFIDSFCSLHVTLEKVTYHNKTCQSEEGIKLSELDTIEVAKKAKALAPPDRLLVAKLEDGFGWEQLCPFLGHPIPETRYPRGNAPKEFQKMADDLLVPRVRKAGLMALSAVLVPTLSVGAWYYLKVTRRH
ncbi:hypothetical protein RRF57_010574 [Xylaria bambusicola]|uniref:Uncharacterized protein n=1 Tax=Xylaria bambusicola TaxID=326684 RepID=A0AAN7UXC8_9PEZI